MSENVKPPRSGWKKFKIIALAIIILGLAGFVGIRYYYPYGEGVKTGQLNFVVYKGVVFKTYEGKLIQTGFWSNSGGIQSNEFEFSISDPKIADSLMHAGGQIVDLHYKEYFGTLPWRGHSRYIVDDILKITPSRSNAMEVMPPVAE
ncbi:hypothetical protein [Bacteroides sp. 51]|uniref:hypothetical protein n=1 Tax=Bacteroides sp. 51 TaxID=2302938 RepID=UPI0013CF8C26|nr:hypothetical protein [Bacteroides sp. 51]NDV84461.1 hypothetical protein [Bacteroides sp. 51]